MVCSAVAVCYLRIMKAQLSSRSAVIFVALLALLSLWIAGCKSSPKIDWNSRIGDYTYDQAVLEFGPPDRSTKTSDGRTVADWIERSSGSGFSFGVGTGFSSGHSAVGVGQSVGTGYHDHVLRLTFGPDNKLAAWAKN
jgi:hypothetical protein